MNQKKMAPAPAITLGDIYYVLFRRKWMILGLSLVTICTAAGIYLKYPFPYVSEARLFIRYVMDTGTDINSTAQISTPDKPGSSVLNSEVDILTSRDVALKAAMDIGPAKIMGKGSITTNAEAAASTISSGIFTELPKYDDVITVTYTDTDPTLVQPVLRAVIDEYKLRHKMIHISDGVTEEFLSAQAELSQGRLSDAARELHEKLASAGISDFEDAKKSLGEQVSRLQGSIFDSAAELAQCKASIEGLRKMYPDLAATSKISTNGGSSTAPSLTTVAQYQQVCREYERLQAEQDNLLGHMTTNSPYVQAGQVGLDSVRAEKEKLETQWPTLLSVRTDSRDGSQTGKVTPQEQLFDNYLKADGLSARISTLSNELSGVQSNITMVNNLEASTAGLRRTTEVEEAAYKHWLESVDKARISNAMGPGRVSNIGEVESPTPPARDRKMMMKVVGGTLFGGLALAFGLPFLLELYFNRTFRHPEDVHLKLDLPLLVSIPKTNGHKRLLAPAAAQLALPASKTVGGGAEATEEIGRTMVNMPDASQLEPWSRNHALQPYFETLRDGLISYFEMLNLTHKPKLVAVTSCGVGAGVTTTAAGLAASLSETGDGNVLLVNMNSQDGEAHHFYKGKLSCGLDEVLEKEKRRDAQVQDNLYVAKNFANNDSLPRTLPKRFSHLVPKMKASDFDYIIFDMPPISQISITARLSRFMDMVLMVVESERTDLETAKRAAQCLVETKTNVGVILNKTRSYVPKRLWHEM